MNDDDEERLALLLADLTKRGKMDVTSVTLSEDGIWASLSS